MKMYNLVYIHTHDTGRMIEPYGYAVKTPTLQEFAEDALLFTHAYCCSPTCSPSRAAMLTGRYPHQNGMLGLAQRGFLLNQKEHHLAYYLRNQGYFTALSGIQHETGWYLDFQEEEIKELGYREILTASAENYKKEDLYLWDKENVNRAVEWLKSLKGNQPFMLSYGMHSTHRPYPIQVDEHVDERYVMPHYSLENNASNRQDQAQYCMSAKEADWCVAQLLHALKELNLYEKTIILFTTDHGLALPYHKCNLNDQGLGVSLILRHPECAKGKVVDHLVSQIDIFPTLCDCLSLEKPTHLEGISFYEMMKNQAVSIRKEVYAEVNFHTSYEPIRCIRTERYKLIRYYDETWLKTNCSNIDQSKPKEFLMSNGLRDRIKVKEALYDCYYDTQEVHNVIQDSQYCEIANELRKKLEDFMIKTQDPLLEGRLIIKPEYKVNRPECLIASSQSLEDYEKQGRGPK